MKRGAGFRSPGAPPPVARRSGAALILLALLVLPILLVSPITAREYVRTGPVSDLGASEPGTSSTQFLHARNASNPANYSSGTKPTASASKSRSLEMISGTPPVASNVLDTKFNVSWVMEVNGTGRVECSTDADLRSPASVWSSDTRPGLASGAVYIEVTKCGGANPLTSGDVVYWRAWFNTTGLPNGASQVNVSWPPGPPFPRVVTKTAAGTASNPIFTMTACEDVNGGGCGAAPDVSLSNFLVYANHTGHGASDVGAGPLAFRASGTTAYVYTYLMRDDDPTGAAHALVDLHQVRFTILTLYNNATGAQNSATLWKSGSTHTCSGSPCGAASVSLPLAAYPNFPGVGFGRSRAVLFSDQFRVAGLFSSAKWTTTGDPTIDAVCGAASASNSARFLGTTADTIESVDIDASKVSTLKLRYSLKRGDDAGGCKSPDSADSETLTVKYRDTAGTFQTVTTHSGTAAQTFTRFEHLLPVSARGSALRVRFESSATNVADESWAIDNLEVLGEDDALYWETDAAPGTTPVAGVFSRFRHQSEGPGAPTVTDLSRTAFRVIWTAREPVKGMIQVGTDPNLVGATYKIDARWRPIDCSGYTGSNQNCVRNGTNVVDATGLPSGTRHYWRAVENNGQGHNRSFPSTPPYPSVWTKTNLDAPPTGNPTLLLQPIADVDENDAGSCTGSVAGEYRLRNFTAVVRLVSPQVSEPLGGRASGGGGPGGYNSCTTRKDWRITINLNNLRANTSAGAPIDISAVSSVVSIRVQGLHNDSGGRNLWSREWRETIPSGGGTLFPPTWPHRRAGFLGLDDRATHILRVNASSIGYLGSIFVDSAESRVRNESRTGSVTTYYDVAAPSSTHAVLFGGRDIAYTENGGTRWNGSADADLWAHVWYGGDMISATTGWAAGTETDGTGYAVARTITNGSTWELKTSGSTGDLREIVASGSSTAMAVGRDTLICTSNAGGTWSSFSAGGNRYYDVAAVTTKLVAVADGGIISQYSSWPGCVGSWSSVGGSVTTRDLYGVACSGTTCIAVGNGTILRSSSSGDSGSWSHSHDGHIAGFRYRSIAAVDSSVFVAVGEGGRVLRTANAGVSWTPQKQVVHTELRAVALFSATVGYLAGDGATVVRNVSAGWSLRSLGSSEKVRAYYEPDGRRHGSAAVVFDSSGESSYYSFKQFGDSRVWNLTTHMRASAGGPIRYTGAFMHRYDNEAACGGTGVGTGVGCVIINATVNMTNSAFTNSDISRAFLRIYNYTSWTLLYQSDMTRLATVGSLAANFTSGSLDPTLFGGGSADGAEFVAIVDAFDIDGGSDEGFGDTLRKTAWFQLDDNNT